MARPSKHDWEEIQRHYESGMAQPDIVKKFKCPRSTLSEKAKHWAVNEQAKAVVKEIVTVSEQINELNEQDNELTRVATEIGLKKADKIMAITTVAENLLVRINQSIINNEKVELVKVKQYEKGRVKGETVVPVTVAHDSGDHKAHADAIDRIAVTVGVADRHAPKSDTNVNVQQNQATQVNQHADLTDEELSKAMRDRGLHADLIE